MRTWAGRIALCVLLAGVVVVQGCASGPKFEPVVEIPADKGLVYLYRSSSGIGCGVVPPLKANGQTICSLHVSGYYPYFASPGEVEFEAATEAKSAVTVDVKAQETYFVKQTINIGFFIGRPHLMVVPNETGLSEIKGCRKEEP